MNIFLKNNCRFILKHIAMLTVLSCPELFFFFLKGKRSGIEFQILHRNWGGGVIAPKNLLHFPLFQQQSPGPVYCHCN